MGLTLGLRIKEPTSADEAFVEVVNRVNGAAMLLQDAMGGALGTRVGRRVLTTGNAIFKEIQVELKAELDLTRAGLPPGVVVEEPSLWGSRIGVVVEGVVEHGGRRHTHQVSFHVGTVVGRHLVAVHRDMILSLRCDYTVAELEERRRRCKKAWRAYERAVEALEPFDDGIHTWE